MTQKSQEHALRPQNETTPIANSNEQNNEQSGAGFQLPPDDPRSINNRGGLEAVIERTTQKLDYETSAQDLGPADDGTTGFLAGKSALDADYVGAGTAGSTTSTITSGITQQNTTGAYRFSAQVPGVGASENVIGAQKPALESSNDDIETGGARVDDNDGQPL